MEHLTDVGIDITCKTYIDADGDGWHIALFLKGKGGSRNVDLVSEWLHDLLTNGTYSDEVPPGSLQ
jgi:hypothetical protein